MCQPTPPFDPTLWTEATWKGDDEAGTWRQFATIADFVPDIPAAVYNAAEAAPDDFTFHCTVTLISGNLYLVQFDWIRLFPFVGLDTVVYLAIDLTLPVQTPMFAQLSTSPPGRLTTIRFFTK